MVKMRKKAMMIMGFLVKKEKKEGGEGLIRKSENEDAGVADAGGCAALMSQTRGLRPTFYNTGRTQTRARAPRRVNT